MKISETLKGLGRGLMMVPWFKFVVGFLGVLKEPLEMVSL
jgi:hypothetical protein